MINKKILLLICLYTFSVVCDASWRNEHERGWHWYEKIEEENKRKQNPSVASNPSTYTQKLNEYREKGEELRAKAILERTPESVQALMAWEKTMWNNSEHFGALWQAMLREHPEFDYSVTHPTNQYARSLYLDEQKKQVKSAIDKLKQNYGLIFFFKGGCSYCHAMAPIVATLAHRHGFSLNGISLDGAKVQGMPALPDNGLSYRFQVSMVPAIYAINPLTGNYFPIATGAISEQDIEERIYQIAEYQSLEHQGNDHVK